MWLSIAGILVPCPGTNAYRACAGGKICLEGHFKQLWGKNTPKFGIAHSLAMGVRLHALPIWVAAPSPCFLTQPMSLHSWARGSRPRSRTWLTQM